jgi:hypothetical protein
MFAKFNSPDFKSDLGIFEVEDLFGIWYSHFVGKVRKQLLVTVLKLPATLAQTNKFGKIATNKVLYVCNILEKSVGFRAISLQITRS